MQFDKSPLFWYHVAIKTHEVKAMKKNTIIKVLLDVVMLVLYLILTFGRFADGLFHEAAGIGIGILFIIHVALNKAMTKGLYKSVKNRKAKPDRIILFFSDILLTLYMPAVIITGILIGREMFVVPFDYNWDIVYAIHNIGSYVCLGIMLLHLLLHAKYLKGVFRKLPASFRSKEMVKALLTFGTGVIVAVLVYTCLNLYFGNSSSEDCTSCSACQNSTCPLAGATTAPSSPTSQPTEAAMDYTSSPPTTEFSIPQQYFTTSAESSEYAPAVTTEAPSASADASVPTLEEYLASIICDGCNKGCTLLNPRCPKGRQAAEEAKEEYYRLYLRETDENQS